MAQHEARLGHKGVEAEGFAHLANRLAGDRSRREPLERTERLVTDDAVRGEPDVALEVRDRGRGTGSEDAVDPTAVEPEATQPALEIDDVVSSKVRPTQVQVTIAQLPAGLDQRGPRRLVADPVVTKSTRLLEGADSGLGRDAVLTRDDACGLIADRGEPPLEVANGVAPVARIQWEPVGRNSFNSSSN
jgi:hypothetical protein